MPSAPGESLKFAYAYLAVLCNPIHSHAFLLAERFGRCLSDDGTDVRYDPHPSLLYVIPQCHTYLGVITLIFLCKFWLGQVHFRHRVAHSPSSLIRCLNKIEVKHGTHEVRISWDTVFVNVFW